MAAFLPVGAAALQHHLLADLDLGRLVGAGADRADAPLALVLRMQDQGRIVEQVLRDRELRGGAVQLDGVVVDLLDRVGVPQLGRHLRRAVLVLLAGVDVLEHEALEQAEHRRAHIGIEPALDVPDDVVGDQVFAVGPLDAGPQLQGPGLEVLARRPALEQERNRDAVGLGAAEVVVALAHDVGIVHPREGVRVVDRGHANADAEDAALRRLGLGRFHERLAQDLAGDAIGNRCRHAEQGGGAQELAPVELALLERIDQARNGWMVAVLAAGTGTHVGTLPVVVA